MDANSVNSVCYKACINVHTRRPKIKIPTIIAEKIERKHLWHLHYYLNIRSFCVRYFSWIINGYKTWKNLNPRFLRKKGDFCSMHIYIYILFDLSGNGLLYDKHPFDTASFPPIFKVNFAHRFLPVSQVILLLSQFELSSSLHV